MTTMLFLGGAVLVAAVVVFAAIRYLTWVPGRPHRGPLPPLTADEAMMAGRLAAHIKTIAREPHNLFYYEELEQAARYIESELRALGYEPLVHWYELEGKAVRNIEATIEAADPRHSHGTLVVGAHYDSFGDAPGGNDNATGVAAVLELARLLADLRGKTTACIRLVLFVNEEPPFFMSPAMGSYQYARMLAERRERVIGMISLETLGCFRDGPGTQQYPAPLGLLYPNEGNFIAFVGLIRSRRFLHAIIRSFRSHTAFPSVGGVAPRIIPGIDWSDHWSFEEFGYPAVMITDTALYRDPHYHLPSDTPDKVDVQRLARITRGIERTVREMARPDWPTAAVAPRS